MGQNDIILLFLCLVFLLVVFEVIPIMVKVGLFILVSYMLYEAFFKDKSSFLPLAFNCAKSKESSDRDSKNKESKPKDIMALNKDYGMNTTPDDKILGREFLQNEYIGQDDLNFNSVDLTPFDIENFADAPSDDNLGLSEQYKKIIDFENQPYEIVSQYTHAEDILGKHDTEPHDIDEQLAFKQRDRGEKNFNALTGITSATRNAFDRYLRGELDENEARVWYSAEADVSNDL